MSSSARSFLELVTQRGVLEDEAIQEYQSLIDESLVELSAQVLAQQMVEGGHLTAPQAKKLLSDLGVVAKPASAPAAPAKPAPKPAAKGGDDLGLADLGDDFQAPGAKKAAAPAAPAKPAPKSPAAEPPADDIILLEDAADAPAPAKPAAPAAKPTPRPAPAKPVAKPAAAKPAAPAAAKPAPRPPAKPAPSAGLQPLPAAPGGLQPLDGGLAPLGDGGLMPMGDLGAGLDAMPAPGNDPFAAAGGLGAPDAAAAPAATLAGPAFKKVDRKSWDSMKFFFLLGAVILVVAGTPFLWYVLTRGTASEMFEAAETDYKSQSYTQAIAKYDKYLKTYPSDPNVSLARVRRGLAMIRGVVEGSQDARQGLTRAQEVIPEISSEERFADARPELAGILPDIASKLAKQAFDAGAGDRAKELVALAVDAMKLVDDPALIPTSLRTSMQNSIDDTKRTIGEAERNIRQAEMLVDSLQKMQEALDKNETSRAFEIRKQLLKEFPGLETHEQLMAIVLKVATAEQSQVKSSDQVPAAATEDHPETAPGLKSIVLSHRRGDSIESAAGQVAFVLARGAVYGIDVASGRIMWRRFVGHETMIHPQPIAKGQVSDALIADNWHLEIARLEAKTGKLVWRLPIGERFANPAILGDRAYITTAAGRVVEVNLETGKATRATQLPQGASVEVGGTSALPLAYQPGMHSNLYVLGADSMDCKEVYYLGHKAGTIAVPPVMSLNHLFVAENAGSDYALIHIVATDETGLKLERPADQEPIRVTGNVVAPMIQLKNRVMITTDRASLMVLEVDTSNKRKPIKIVAQRSSVDTSPVPSQMLAEAAQVWIGNDRFVGYDIQASREQLAPKWVKHEQEWFVAPLQKFGPTLVHVRRRRGSPGVTVAGVKPDTGAILWQTDLAVPLAYVGQDAAKNQTVILTAHGELFRLSPEALAAGFLDKPTETAEVEGSATTFSFTEAYALDEHRVALVSEFDRGNVVIFDPRRTGDELASSRLDTSGSPVNTAPLGFGGGVIATTEAGGIWWLAAETGKNLGLPFQPQLGPGETVPWVRPGLVPGGREFVAADGRGKLYRVAISEKPAMSLQGAGQTNVTEPLVGAIGVGQGVAVGWSRGPSSDALRIFPLPGLTGGQDIPLKGRVLQGPWSSPLLVFVVSDKEGLMAIGSNGQLAWETPLAYGPLSSGPRIDGDSVLFTTQQGFVVRLAADSGKELGKAQLQQPLYGSPIPQGNQLLVPGADGVLYFAPNVP